VIAQGARQGARDLVAAIFTTRMREFSSRPRLPDSDYNQQCGTQPPDMHGRNNGKRNAKRSPNRLPAGAWQENRNELSEK
jgi:hypothetical protein